jgi:enoyl-CoA hydratase/carnithine racemase
MQVTGTITTERDGYVATVTINNAAKRNAMSQTMWIGMGDAILELSNDA